MEPLGWSEKTDLRSTTDKESNRGDTLYEGERLTQLRASRNIIKWTATEDEDLIKAYKKKKGNWK